MGKRSRLKKKRYWLIFLIIATVAVLYLCLELIVEHYVNKQLRNLKGYTGQVEDVDIQLWRGAYSIDELVIDKVGEDGSTEPFFYVHLIDLSIEWPAIWEGEIVGSITMESPRLNFIKVGDTVQSGGGNDYVEVLESLIPIEINRFEIRKGELHYLEPQSSPPIDLALHSIDLLATNISNATESSELLPSRLEVSAHSFQEGVLTGSATFNVLKNPLVADINAELKSVPLTELNAFSESYANFTFEEGSLYIGTEIAMNEGRMQGYLKPILSDVKIVDLSSEEDSFWRKVWEVALGTVLELFENHPHDQIATEVPISGNIEGKSGADITRSLINILKNAFISAFEKNVDQSISIEDVSGREESKKEKEGFFESIFGGDDDEKNKTE